jgi:hypothetical protein
MITGIATRANNRFQWTVMDRAPRHVGRRAAAELRRLGGTCTLWERWRFAGEQSLWCIPIS